MVDVGSRPVGRLLCLAGELVVAAMILSALPLVMAQGGPATTTVSDTVFRADGHPAQGSLVVIWPAFITASGTPVAAGSATTTLGSGGALSIALVPNAGATPTGTYYLAVFQIGP